MTMPAFVFPINSISTRDLVFSSLASAYAELLGRCDAFLRIYSQYVRLAKMLRRLPTRWVMRLALMVRL